MYIQEQVEINRPPEEVYAFVANANNLPTCSGAIVEVRGAPDRPASQGDTYTSVAKLMGRTVETSHRVLSAESPVRLEIEGKTGSTTLMVKMVFEPTETGTRVTQSGEGEPGGALRFVGGMFKRAMQRQVREDLDTLKRALERVGEVSG